MEWLGAAYIGVAVFPVILGVVVWIVLCVLIGKWWRSKGYRGGFLCSFFLSPLLGLIIGAILRPKAKEIEKEKLALGEMKKCPFCAELIKPEAKVCRYCGRDLEESDFREAIQINPNDPEAHNNLGAFFWEKGKYDEAENEYQEAIRLNPDLAEAHYNLGEVLLKQGKIEKAEEALRIAVRLSPDDAEAHQKLGEALLKRGKHQIEAEEEFNKASRLKSGDVVARG